MLVAAIVLIGVSIPLRNIAPVQTEENPDGVISERIGDKTILEMFSAISNGNADEFTLADFPVIIKSIEEVVETSGVDNFINIYKEKLANVKFIYSSTELDVYGNRINKDKGCIIS